MQTMYTHNTHRQNFKLYITIFLFSLFLIGISYSTRYVGAYYDDIQTVRIERRQVELHDQANYHRGEITKLKSEYEALQPKSAKIAQVEPPSKSRKLNDKELNRLAFAVSLQESGKNGKPCNSNVARKYKNCHGLTDYRTGKFRKFKTTAESYTAFKYLWKNSSHYNNNYPRLREASTYAGKKENASIWLNNVLYFYNK